MKADAYGHGIDIVAPLLDDQRIGLIGLASNGEAAAVRASGFTGRLLRVRPAGRDEVDDGIRFGIEEWIGGAEHAGIVAGSPPLGVCASVRTSRSTPPSSGGTGWRSVSPGECMRLGASWRIRVWMSSASARTSPAKTRPM